MNIKQTECDRLGYKYKDVFANILYFIHHTPYANEFISKHTLKMLEELEFKINTGEIEIIEFTRPTHIYFDIDEIFKENKELKERLDYLETKGE